MSFSEIIENHRKEFESQPAIQEMRKAVDEAILKQIIEASKVTMANFEIKTSGPWSMKLEKDMYGKRYESYVDPKLDQDEWKEFVKEEYINTVQELDTNGSVAPVWVLVDKQGVIQPWKLIYSKNGPCWQCATDRGKFADAFLDEGVPNKWGFYEQAYVAEVCVFDKATNGAPGIVVRSTLGPYFGKEL